MKDLVVNSHTLANHTLSFFLYDSAVGRRALSPERVALTGFFLVTAIVLPKAYDPINVPKLLILNLTLAIVALIAFKERKPLFKRIDHLDILVGVFICLMLVNLGVNNFAFSERLYGIVGRSAGFFYYISFALAFFLLRQLRMSLYSYIYALAATNLVISGILLLQSAGILSFSFQEFYSAPSSTLGNPNFVSGFLGFSAPSLFLAFGWVRQSRYRFFIISLSFVINFWAIYETNSIQGFISLLVSLSVFGFGLINLYFSRKVVFSIVIAAIFCGPFLVSISNLATELLGSNSMLSRLDYWRAGISITEKFPVWGVGFDAYGDYYRQFRDDVAFDRFGEGVIADSPHNLFLDCFVSGGIPLGISFLALNLLPLIYFFRAITPKRKLNISEILLVSIWFGYQTQAFITVNQVGVSIWNWALLGLMAQRASKDLVIKRPIQPTTSPLANVQNLIPFFIGVTLTFLMALPLKNHLDLVSAAKYSNGSNLLKIAQRFPKDSKIMASVSMGATSSGLESVSLQILRKAVEHNPRSFYLWKLLHENSMASQAEQLEAKSMMQELDPLYKFPGG